VQSLEAKSSARERLIHIVAKLEREIESTALDAYEHPGGPLSIDPQSVHSEPLRETVIKSHFSPRPLLTPGQLRCIENLNRLPRLKKTLVFFEDVVNSHAMIIARDLKFGHHRKGEAVLRHWADHFEV